MFDFQNLEVYKKAKHFNTEITALLADVKVSRNINDQLTRAAFSIVLNIAEGSGRFSKADRRHFFIISRGSVFECAAIIDLLKDAKHMAVERYEQLLILCEELSKILYTMIRNLEVKK